MKSTLRFYSLFLSILITFFIGCDKKSITVDQQKKLSVSPKRLKLAQEELQKGEFFHKRNVYDSSLYYYNKSQKNFFLAGDSLRANYSLLKIATLYHGTGDYYGSESAVTQILPYFEKAKNTEYLAAAYNLLGMVKRKLKDYDEALRYYNKSKSIITDSLRKGIIDNNIAMIYMEQGHFDDALKLLNDLIRSKAILDNPKYKSLILSSIGEVYVKLNDSRGIHYFLEALNIREQQNDSQGIIASCLHLAEYYSDKDIKRTYTYASQAYLKANEIKNGDEKLKALKFLINSSEGNIRDYYINSFMYVTDSINSYRLKADNKFAKLRYDVKEEQNKNDKLEEKIKRKNLEFENEQIKSQFLFAVAILIIIISILILWLLRLNYKKGKAKEVYKTEQRLSKKIHDELANDVFRVLSFAETLEVDENNKDKLITGLDNVYERTRNISRENSTIDTGVGFADSLKEMLSEYNSYSTKVILVNLQMETINSLNELKKVAIYRVLQELMINMKKHSNATTVAIRFVKVNSSLKIEYKDNGVGFDKNSLSNTNGLANTENRISVISGNIIFESESNGGLSVSITFPV
ncbi:tetratricopeptide repeat-containing sensor histidine kinase [Flavobacterium sp. AG291]|uniref:tetratricopeptide repeat-containing sensor histidine kinase n=1 Tax=Flavobacterium sp. AG291 TaxID=2184000 RepID=UPI000E0AA2D5|nr:tetratricopeptide repeat-containing sensor histidine kinase [Flavobacterium sp. AG291]RDI14439.1 tetratricopeptide repeat protein [Flavobacterium sp. AG291]